MQLGRKRGDFFLLAFIQVKSEDFLKNKNKPQHDTLLCAVLSCLCFRASKHEGQGPSTISGEESQSSSLRQSRHGIPASAPSHLPSCHKHLTGFPKRKSSIITNPLPQRQSNSAGCNYSEPPPSTSTGEL